MSAPSRSYTLHRFYSHEFDGDAERLSMADAKGAEYFALVEVGKGGRELLARRERAAAVLLTAMQQGWDPGRHAVVVTAHTLAHAKRAAPETYGSPREERAAA